MTPAPRAFVIGHPIGHSRSPLIHGFWLQAYALMGSYTRIDVSPDDLAGFLAGLQAAGFVGGNVTVPHKRAVLDLVDEADAAARAIGAVNTIWVDNGRLIGGNTDSIGFTAALDSEAAGWSDGGISALVLGAGGAARAVVHGLLGRGFSVAVVNRTDETAATLARVSGPRVRAEPWSALSAAMTTADILVNATSLGMVGKPPLVLDLAPLKREAIVCDIVYVPLETALMRQARSCGLRAVGGLGMLLHQAVPGFARWFGRTPEVTPALRAILDADVRAAG